MRFAAAIEYQGTAYKGWQIQPHAESVQEHVTAALSKIADHSIDIVCAGRTDSGVHASYQIIHFDSAASRSPNNWLRGMNSNLPEDVVCLWVVEVDDEFHARFSAQQRAYRYVINNHQTRPGIFAKQVTWERRALNLNEMQQAASHLVGEHDFTSFRTVHCQAKSPVRTVHSLELHQQGAFIYIDIVANAFLHHMVRNIAGVLISIGCGEQPIDWALEVLRAKDRAKAGVTAAPHGLYLTSVTYPADYQLPAPPALITFG